MTNAQLLQRKQSLERAAQVVETARVRFAVAKNLRRTSEELEDYQEALSGLVKSFDVDLDGGLPDDPPEGFEGELEALLQTEVEEPTVNEIAVADLEVEDERGADIPLQVLAGLDFMIVDETLE